MRTRHWTALAAVASLQAPPIAAKPPHRSARAMLFHCTTDHRLTLIPHAADGGFGVASRVPDHRDIRLSIDRRDRTLHLSIGHGAEAQDFVLHDVKQGSTPGSGTGGRADSAITGTSDDQSFLLYAGYDNNGFDFSADLQITGAGGRTSRSPATTRSTTRPSCRTSVHMGQPTSTAWPMAGWPND